MADKKFAIQVTHTVTEVFEVDASTAVDANTKLGMVMALNQAGADLPPDLAMAVERKRESRTIKKVSQARTLIDDPDATPAPDGD